MIWATEAIFGDAKARCKSWVILQRVIYHQTQPIVFAPEGKCLADIYPQVGMKEGTLLPQVGASYDTMPQKRDDHWMGEPPLGGCAAEVDVMLLGQPHGYMRFARASAGPTCATEA